MSSCEVCNSGVYLPPSRAAQCLEETSWAHPVGVFIAQEMFGDISFLDVHVGVWQGCQGEGGMHLYLVQYCFDAGMAIGARAQAVGAELYDMRWPKGSL